MSDPPDHLPTSTPRLLCSVRSPGRDNDPPLLMAWVGCCRPSSDDAQTAAYVSLHGDLCTYSARRMREGLLDYAAYAGDLVVDLSALRFLDTSGVELLEDVSAHLLRVGGFLQVHDPSDAARRVLELIHPDLPTPCHQLTSRRGASTVGR